MQDEPYSRIGQIVPGSRTTMEMGRTFAGDRFLRTKNPGWKRA